MKVKGSNLLTVNGAVKNQKRQTRKQMLREGVAYTKKYANLDPDNLPRREILDRLRDGVRRNYRWAYIIKICEQLNKEKKDAPSL